MTLGSVAMAGHFFPNIPLFLMSETLLDTKFGDVKELLIERSSVRERNTLL